VRLSARQRIADTVEQKVLVADRDQHGRIDQARVWRRLGAEDGSAMISGAGTSSSTFDDTKTEYGGSSPVSAKR